AQEGPMPQTRFVLSKALQMGLRPLVLLNKIDRPNADPDRVLNETFDLFVELGAKDDQLDFKYAYASALEGYAQRTLDDPKDSLAPIFDLIVEGVPAPEGNLDKPFLFQAATVGYDDYLGRQLSGRILEGKVKKGQTLLHIDADGKQSRFTVTMVQGHRGLAKVELPEAGVGDIVCISGVEEGTIGDTLCDPQHPQQLPPIKTEEPTVSITITINDGPLVGRSGKHVTINKIRERLNKEKRSNISFRISECDGRENAVTVAGRGELHLSVLLEAMRREGFEFCVSKPQVILKEEEGQTLEPYAKVFVDVPEDYSGSVIEQLSRRKGEMQHLATNEQGVTHVIFSIPMRGLVGYRGEFLTTTRGLGIMTSTFDVYAPWKGEITGRQRGVLVSMCDGKANGYACFNLEDRGELFIKPGDDVYEGMVVGENSRDNDLVVNMTKAKQLTNVRASGSDENIILTPPRRFSLEQAIGYIEDDELLEVTPAIMRMRKKMLKEHERKRKK
ncbi:MAG: translational GTPase TypA, partial [Chlamydiia bacterium]|nr:translational GTPase TypA [Chlamydiia bacterium]